jgi:hypothetical protein
MAAPWRAMPVENVLEPFGVDADMAFSGADAEHSRRLRLDVTSG